MPSKKPKLLRVFVNGKKISRKYWKLNEERIEFIKPLKELFPPLPDKPKEEAYWMVIEFSYDGFRN